MVMTTSCAIRTLANKITKRDKAFSTVQPNNQRQQTFRNKQHWKNTTSNHLKQEVEGHSMPSTHTYTQRHTHSGRGLTHSLSGGIIRTGELGWRLFCENVKHKLAEPVTPWLLVQSWSFPVPATETHIYKYAHRLDQTFYHKHTLMLLLLR